jgi:hypothetical protein
MFLHVTTAKYIKDYEVEISFNNGWKGIADLSRVLKGKVFEPLKDKALFAKLALNQELATIVWPNGVDLAPEYLFFNTFKDAPEWQDQFKKWGYNTD